MMLLLMLLMHKSFGYSFLFRNNACPTYPDYYLLKINPRCYFNPDVTPNFEIILSNHFSTFSKHSVTTEDGYILNLYQIPQDNPKGVIIMQNSLTLDAIQFVAQGNTSFAYFFYNQGYEIWLSSTRGTTLSPSHETLSQADPEFWNWTFEETGKYDTRTVINYVKKTIDPDLNLIFLGYSQSGGDALIYSSLHPEEAEQNIKLFLLISPVGYYGTGSLFGFLPNLTTLLLNLVQKLGKHSVTQPKSIETRLVKAAFKIIPDKRLAYFLTNLPLGLAPFQDDPNQYYTFLTEMFRGTSTKNIKLYIQQARSSRFQMFDHGKNKNAELYGNALPPEYPVKNIKTPIFIFGGEKDKVVTAQGVKMLFSKLSNDTKIYGGPTFIKNYNHIHFANGKTRVQSYHKMLQILNKL